MPSDTEVDITYSDSEAKQRLCSKCHEEDILAHMAVTVRPSVEKHKRIMRRLSPASQSEASGADLAS